METARVPFLLAAEDTDTLSYGYMELQGSIRKVEAIDLSKDGGVPPRVGSMVNKGRAVHSAHVPTKIIREGPKRTIPDFATLWSMPMVDKRFRDIVERFEPSVHQFFPVEVLWIDGSTAAERYFLVVCNRLDSVHRALTTMRFRGVLWEPVPGVGSKCVFDRSKFVGKHLWRDKHLIGPPLISNELANTLVDAGLSGIRLVEQQEA